MIDSEFWKGKNVFITGHTGFKGTWLTQWLLRLDANVTGYSLPPATSPSLFYSTGIEREMKSISGDIRDKEKLQGALQEADPDIVLHLAAQPLVLESYRSPVETYEINVIGTVNILEAVRTCTRVKSVLNITTDKVYENKEWVWGYREADSLGGKDPYSNSKACSELITSAYRHSFFNPLKHSEHGVVISTARAGNVIGGGDWASERLIPDVVKAIVQKKPITIRNPKAVRPWQHVLDPLRGYLMLCERMYKEGVVFSGEWNFGPDDSNNYSVENVLEEISRNWELDFNPFVFNKSQFLHESTLLKLDCSKAKTTLNWQPYFGFFQAVQESVNWYERYYKGEDARTLCQEQILGYEQLEKRNEYM